jgi:hypothetical protein
MYHVGKIIEILSPKDREIISCDDSVQAVVEMWDENILTVSVEDTLKEKVKIKDLVLVDYKPMSEKLAVPKQLIIKIIRGKKSDAIWKQYKDFHHKGKVLTPKAENRYFG